jgi:hypothetical protein
MTLSQRAQAWLQGLADQEKIVLAALRREVGPNGDLMAAYRDWYRAQMDEHDRVLKRMLLRLCRHKVSRSDVHGG